jgi:hypothetical protein
LKGWVEGGVVVEHGSQGGVGREVEPVFGVSADVFEKAEEEYLNMHRAGKLNRL